MALVTIKTVASEAGVSLATVSRALSGDQRVSDGARHRVMEAVKRLNYRPVRQRAGARWPAAAPGGGPGLGGQTVCLLLLGMHQTLESLPVVASTIHHVESRVAAAGGRLMLCDVPDVTQLPPVMRDHEIDGVIAKGALQGPLVATMGTKLRERLERLPLVWVLGRPVGARGDSVVANDLEVGRLAAEHLVKKGHRRLAFLNPKPGHLTFERRQLGFQAAAASAGATVTAYVEAAPGQWQLPLRPARGIESVEPLIDKLLAARDRPTAVFVPADNITALVYRVLRSRNVGIGEDLSVISANNERQICGGMFPELTTIDTRVEQIAEHAVDRLAARLSGRGSEDAIELAPDPSIILGQSVAAVA